MTASDDVRVYLTEKGYTGVMSRNRMESINAPVHILVENSARPSEPYHLIDVDTVGVTLTIVEGYGQRGDSDASVTADKLYRELFLLTHINMNGNPYLSVKALGAPTESTFGEVTQYSFTIEMVRYLGDKTTDESNGDNWEMEIIGSD